MARAALILLLAFAAAGAALATPDYSALPYDEGPQEGFEEKELPSEEERAGQEEQWHAHDAPQDENLEKTAAEQQTQQVQDRQVSVDVDAGTAGRLREEIQGNQQRQGKQQWPGNQHWQDNQQWQGNQQWQQRQGQGQEWGQQDRLWGAITPQPNNDFGIVGQGGSWPLDTNPPRPRVLRANSGVSGQPPPSDYRRIKEFGYFKVYSTPRTWPEALMTCLAEGANLAVPTNEAEALLIGALYAQVKTVVKKAHDKNLFFIGASDLHKEGSFLTLFGTKFKPNGVKGYNWKKGEPNNHRKSEHCVLSNDKGLYWDGNCQSKFAFVCQYNTKCMTVGTTEAIEQQTRY